MARTPTLAAGTWSSKLATCSSRRPPGGQVRSVFPASLPIGRRVLFSLPLSPLALLPPLSLLLLIVLLPLVLCLSPLLLPPPLLQCQLRAKPLLCTLPSQTLSSKRLGLVLFPPCPLWLLPLLLPLPAL